MNCIPALILVTIWMLDTSAQAAKDFELTPIPRQIPERGQVVGYALWCGSNQFLFIPPQGWKAKANPIKKEVVLMRGDLVTSITMRFPQEEVTKTVDKTRMRERVQKSYPSADLMEEFPCYTQGHEGRCIGFEWITAANTKAYSHLAWVPFEKGLVEFQLTAPKSKFFANRKALGGLLGSFRAQSEEERKKESMQNARERSVKKPS